MYSILYILWIHIHYIYYYVLQGDEKHRVEEEGHKKTVEASEMEKKRKEREVRENKTRLSVKMWVPVVPNLTGFTKIIYILEVRGRWGAMETK